MLNHYILFDKLVHYCIKGILNKWFRSYLSHHAQFVKVIPMDHNNSMLNRYLSSHSELPYDVPHICLFYTQMIYPYMSKVQNMVLYPDDTNTLVEHRDEFALKLKISSVMKQLEVWFLNNRLLLNRKKQGQYLFIIANVDSPINHSTLITIRIISPTAQN